MFKMDIFIKLCLIVFSLSLSQLTFAWDVGTPDYRSQSFTIDLVQQKKDIRHTIVDILDSKDGQALAAALASSFDVSQTAVTTAAALAKVVKKNRSSETTYLDLTFPSGFMPCKIRVERVSLNGPGHVSLRVYSDRIGAYLYLKRNNMFDGRSWAKLKVDVLSLYWRDYRNTGNNRAAYEDGTCDYRVHPDMPESETKVILNESFS